MVKYKIKVEVKDWRTMGVVGFLFGIVVGTAPQFIGMLLLATGLAIVLKLVEKERM